MGNKSESKFGWASIPVINYTNLLDEQEAEDLVRSLKEIHAAHDEEGAVEFHKARLGKQMLCWNGPEFRYWVWEGRDWRAFASNKSGTSLEVRAGLSKERAWRALDDYMATVGLKQ